MRPASAALSAVIPCPPPHIPPTRAEAAVKGATNNSGFTSQVRITVDKCSWNSRKLFASVNIAAPAELVWECLNDYDGLASFIPSLVENRCIEKKENGAVLYQVCTRAHQQGAWRGVWGGAQLVPPSAYHSVPLQVCVLLHSSSTCSAPRRPSSTPFFPSSRLPSPRAPRSLPPHPPPLAHSPPSPCALPPPCRAGGGAGPGHGRQI